MNDIAIERRKVRDYWFVDGFQEMAGGSAITVFAGLMLASIVTGSPFLQTAALVVLLASVAGVACTVNAAKHRVTYPRTGRVTERVSDKGARVAGIVAWTCIAIPVLSAWEKDPTFSAPALIIAAGLATAATIVLTAYRRRDARLIVPAVLTTAAAILAASMGVSAPAGIMVMFLTAGVCSIAVGALTLAGYLATNPSVAEESAS